MDKDNQSFEKWLIKFVDYKAEKIMGDDISTFNFITSKEFENGPEENKNQVLGILSQSTDFCKKYDQACEIVIKKQKILKDKELYKAARSKWEELLLNASKKSGNPQEGQRNQHELFKDRELFKEFDTFLLHDLFPTVKILVDAIQKRKTSIVVSDNKRMEEMKAIIDKKGKRSVKKLISKFAPPEQPHLTQLCNPTTKRKKPSSKLIKKVSNTSLNTKVRTRFSQ